MSSGGDDRREPIPVYLTRGPRPNEGPIDPFGALVVLLMIAAAIGHFAGWI